MAAELRRSSLDLMHKVLCTTLGGLVNYLFFIVPPLSLPPVTEAGGYCLEHAVCNLNSRLLAV